MKRTSLLVAGILATALILIYVLIKPQSDLAKSPEPAHNQAGSSSNEAATAIVRQAAENNNETETASSSPRAVASSSNNVTGLVSPAGNNPNSQNQSPNNADTSTAEATQANSREPDSNPVLSQEVFEIIDEVQKRFLEGQWIEGANELNALYEDFDSLNDFEKATILNFYTNLLLANNMLPEAMGAFEAILELQTLRPDVRLRAIRALGQISRAEGQLEDAVSYFNQFLNQSEERNGSVLLDLANAHFELDQYSEAIPPLAEHIELLISLNEEVDRNKLGLLNTLAVESGEWDSAATVSELMIEVYDDPRDWRNLAEIYQRLNDNDSRQQLMADALTAGHIDASGTWIGTDSQ